MKFEQILLLEKDKSEDFGFEYKAGRERLVSRVENMLIKKGKNIPRAKIRNYFKNQEKNEPDFVKSTKKAAQKKCGNNWKGYFFTVISARAMAHFMK